MLAVAVSAHALTTNAEALRLSVPEASHPAVTSDARFGRIQLAEQLVTTRCHSFTRDFVSHPNAKVHLRGRLE
jgi:hypothetical protein